MELYGVIENIELYFAGEMNRSTTLPMSKDTSGGNAVIIPRQGDMLTFHNKMYKVEMVGWNWDSRTATIWLA